MTEDQQHTLECAQQVERLVRELAPTIAPSELNRWFWMLRADLGCVQLDLEEQDAETTTA